VGDDGRRDPRIVRLGDRERIGPHFEAECTARR
jgi:hypothetical protein